MEDHYKKLFTIQKCLRQHNVPDDLIPIFFQYLGDLNETEVDLINKYCFYKVCYDDPYFRPNGTIFTTIHTHLGYYCNVCERILKYKSHKQLKNHIKIKSHQNNIKFKCHQYDHNKIDHQMFKLEFFSKIFRYNDKVKSKMFKTIKLNNVILHNTQC